MANRTIVEELVSGLPTNPAEHIMEFSKATLRFYQSSPGDIPKSDCIAIFLYYKKFSARFDTGLVSIRGDLNAQNVKSSDIVDIARVITSKESILIESAISGNIDSLISELDSANSSETFGIARLNAHEKQKIHDHLNRIRQLIEASDISTRKKNSLFDRLNSLAAEVDALGTKTDQFFAFMGDIAFVLGDMTQKAKPLINEVKDMMKIVSRSRAREEGVSLPRGDEPVLLPPPDEE